MDTNLEKILVEVLKNKRVSAKVDELNLTEEQKIEALPILIDMADEVDDENKKFLTSFRISNSGFVKRIQERSTYWKKFRYLENIKTQHITQVDFEDSKEFIKEDERKVLLKYMSRFFEESNSEFKKGLYIHGKMGVGKTFVAKRLAKKLAESGKEVGFIFIGDLVSIMMKSFDANTDSNYFDEIQQLMKSVDYLFIDDVGSEQISTWFRDNFLFFVLNERYQKQRTTFFTSNYSMDELKKIQARTAKSNSRDYDKSERLLNRIKALSDEVELKGSNKR